MVSAVAGAQQVADPGQALAVVLADRAELASPIAMTCPCRADPQSTSGGPRRFERRASRARWRIDSSSGADSVR